MPCCSGMARGAFLYASILRSRRKAPPPEARADGVSGHALIWEARDGRQRTHCRRGPRRCRRQGQHHKHRALHDKAEDQPEGRIGPRRRQDQGHQGSARLPVVGRPVPGHHRPERSEGLRRDREARRLCRRRDRREPRCRWIGGALVGKACRPGNPELSFQDHGRCHPRHDGCRHVSHHRCHRRPRHAQPLGSGFRNLQPVL